MQDADRLEALGAIGIARTFAYGGNKHIPMYDPNIEPDVTKKETTSVNHFHEKCFNLKDMMNTHKAKEIAIERDKYMRLFLREFLGIIISERHGHDK